MANQKLNATITIGGAVAGSLKSALGTTSGKLQQIGRTVDQLKNRQKELNRVIAEQEKLGKGGSALKVQYAQAEIGAINKQIDALRRKGDWLRRELDLTNRIKEARSKFAGEAMSRAAGAVALGGAVALPAFSLLKESAKFNYDLQLIGNTADMSRAEIEALGKSIMDASKVTGQSATTLQKAIGFLVAAGMDVKTANESIVTIGRSSTAAGADIEDLAKAAFVLNDALKIAPKDLQSALDTLAQAGKEGNVELKDMAKVLPVLGSGMTALKMQGREAAATMGAALEVARKGAADPDEAANNMKNFIAKVMSPETLKKATKNFDLDLYKVITDAQKKGRNPFEAAMTAIMAKTKGDQKAIGDLFSDMQVQNFIRPLMQNWDEYQRIKEKALGASGVTDRDFDKIMATSKSQLDRFGNSIERVRIMIGDTLEPAFGKLNAQIEPVIDKLEIWIKDNKEMVGTGVLVVGALAAVGATALAIGAAIAGLGFVVTSLATGWGLMAAAAVGAAVLIWNKWEAFSEFFKGIVGGLRQTWNDAWEAMGLVVDSIVGRIQSAFSAIGNAFNWVGSSFQPASAKLSPPSAGSMKIAPPVPAMAGGGSSSATTTYNNQINVTQAPGEKGDDLANRIIKKMHEHNARERRGRMFDPAMAGGY